MIAPPTGIGPLPARISDFLSGTYYAISIVVVLIGLVAWSVHQQTRIDNLEERQRDHPSKTELTETAIRIDNRITDLERGLQGLARHVDDLDQHGTRALADRMNAVEYQNRSQDERIQEMARRLNEAQAEVNKVSATMATVVERQNVNTDQIKVLQQRVWNSGGERGPTAPSR